MGAGVFLQDKECDSMPEYYFGIALENLGYEYRYHWKIGIAGTAGSIEVDFIVYAPTQIPIEIMADYWHPNVMGENEVIRIAKIRDYFHLEPILIDSKEIFSISAAMTWIKANLP